MMKIEKLNHNYKFKVLESHLDTFGHVNHATYLQLLEEARWEMITEKHYGMDVVQKTGKGPIILEVKITFKRELLLRREFTINTQLLSNTRKTATLIQRILNSENKVCAEAEIRFGILDIKKRKLVTPPPEWLWLLGIDLDEEASASSTETLGGAISTSEVQTSS